MIVINIILLNLIVGFIGGYVFRIQAKRIEALEFSNKKLINDINSLHRNQTMLVSSFKELHRVVRKYDKNVKKQNIRVETEGS